jgi:hypothetical protein
VHHVIILALATSRDEGAFGALFGLIAKGSTADSTAAVEALAIYGHDEALQRVRAAPADAPTRVPAGAPR